MREEPIYASLFSWKEFNIWADKNGIGEHKDDWDIFWSCWQWAIRAVMNEEGNND